MERLIHKIVQQDRQACRMLYDQFSRAMYNVCLRMLNSEEEAMDALQETFASVFTHIGKLEEPAALPAWIKKICVNVCLRMIREKRKLSWTALEDQPVFINLNAEKEVVDEEEYANRLEALSQAVARLPDKYRIVFTLYAIEDYSHEQISQMLGIPGNTCRSQYMRAKQKVIDYIKSSSQHARSNQKIHSGSPV